MQDKFKKGQIVKVTGKIVLPECRYKTGRIKETDKVMDGCDILYTISIDGQDRYFYQEELERVQKEK